MPSRRGPTASAGVDERLLDAHLDRCRRPGLRRGAVPVGRGSHRPSPDLPRRVARAAARADRAATWSIVQALLAVVAVEIIVVSVPPCSATSRRRRPTPPGTSAPSPSPTASASSSSSPARPAPARCARRRRARRRPRDQVGRRPRPAPHPARGRGRPPPGGRQRRARVADRRAVAALTRWSRSWCRHRLELAGPHADREVPRPGEAEVGGRLVAADTEGKDLGT